MTKKIDIGGELHSVATDHKVADASEIKDISKGNKSQTAFNNDINRHEVEIHGTGGIDSRLKDVEQIEQIVLDGGEAQIAQGSDFTDPDATKRAKIPTVGAVLDGMNDGVYDVSKRNPTGGENSDGKFTLAYILANANTLIPTSRRHGGMIISFISSVDNKYVQYRLMSDDFTTDTTQWAIADEGFYVENPEFVYVKTDNEDKMLWAVRTDGSIYYGAGVPSQIIDYINEKIADLSLDEYENIVAFLDNLEKGDKTLQDLLDEKVNKEKGKSLIDEEYAESIYYIESPEFIEVKLDQDDRILEATMLDGTKLLPAGVKISEKIDFEGNEITIIENPEFIEVKLDAARHILWGIQKNGNVYFGAGVPQQVIDYIDILLGTKADKEENKSLIDAEYASSQSTIENSEYIKVTLDSEDKVLEGTRVDGTKVINLPIDTPSATIKYVDNSEWIRLLLDSKGKIIEGIRADGRTNNDNKIDSIDKNLKYLDSEVEELTKYISPMIVPAYYMQNNYLSNKVKIISNYIRKSSINGDAFYFVTDTHWDMNEKHSPAIIKEINKTLNIHKLFHGGDLYQERNINVEDDRFYQVDCLNSFRRAMGNDHVYLTDGNHEYIFDRAKWGDYYAVARMFLDDIVLGGTHKNYYYVDNKQNKIRYICYASYGEYINGSIYNGYQDQEQIDWLQNIALNTEEGYSVFFFTHHIISGPMDIEKMEYNLLGFQENIAPILENYNSGDKGRIIACICGHSHRDCIDNDTYSFPVIVSTCDNNRILDKFSPARTTGTIEEQAFDVVVFNKDEEVIHCIRIGCRANNQAINDTNKEFVECRSVYYNSISVGNTITLDTYMSDSVMWQCSNTTVATINGNVLTAVSEGSVRVTATDTSGNKHSLYIKVK